MRVWQELEEWRARERGCGGEEKRDLSGKSEREGEKWRQDEGRGDAGKDCWDRRLGDWTGRALERNALFLREHGERTWGAEARVDVELRPWAGGGAEVGDSR